MGEKKKKNHTQIIEEYIDHHGLKKGSLTNGSVKGYGTLDVFLISVHDDGFDIFLLKDEAVCNVSSYIWSQFSEVEIDKFALSTGLSLLGEKEITLKITEDKPFYSQLEKHNIKMIFKKRKWQNKLLGFRSQNKLKMAIATTIYLTALLLIVVPIVTYNLPSAKQERETIEAAKIKNEANEKENRNKEAAAAKELYEKQTANKKQQKENDRELETNTIDRLQKYIDSSDGQLMKIEPMTNSWDNVYAFVSDSFKTMPLSEKESWVNETASDIKNRIIGGGIAEDPRIYFVYEDQSKLAVPDTFNESYKIKD
ncbi:hypothetical protein ABEX69_07025 [Bacillus safensis]|uniref:hypothetical protein n=1 Tax=Bacillus safensis TaxID=561879 RepID=UPI0022815BC3|nr:hypothetical protein [Bacillus safensis]MCY7563850.1 hypothetical protein [Bacillus safensis]MCY7626382.1 hypothetical protein [Bacillus safensis]MCY7632466.1 hypothetical protein [Bacillus safensis]MCY7646878.1 hypothetical protein [Bacillus safensis]MCY7652608.1 hypothetical protein [Bacillus safensis]